MSDAEVMEFDAGSAQAEDIDWDSVEETVDFPEETESSDTPLAEAEEVSSENEEQPDAEEVDILDTEEEPASEEPKDEESKDEEEAKEDEEDSESDESKEEESLPENLTEKGLVSKDGEVGKMVKIDGEESFVSLEELGNDYSGQKVLKQRFSELDASKKSFGEEVASIENYVADFAAKINGGDVVGAMQYFGSFAGTPPYMIKEQMIAALTPEIQRRMQMSAPELQNELLQEQNTYLQDQNESEVKRSEAEQAQRELSETINNARETLGISEGEWNEAVKELSEFTNSEKITTEDVGAYVNNLKAYDKAESVLTSMEISLEGNDSFVDTLQKIVMDNPDFTDDDLKSIVEKANADVKKQAIAKDLESKVAKNAPKKTVSKEQKKREESESQYSSLDEDDWDDLL